MDSNSVLWITYYWPPSGGPGVQRSVKFARYLPNHGIQPIILTVDPQKASYPFFDNTLLNEIPSGTKVFHSSTFEPLSLYAKLAGGKIPQPGFANETKPGIAQKISRFIRGNFFIPDARIGWNRFALKKAREIIKNENIKAIVTSSPPHSSQLIGLELKKNFKLPWIADMRDPWTDIYYYSQFYHTKWAASKDARLEKEVLENADAVIVVSESIKKLFCKKSPHINPDKIHVIPNGFDENDFKTIPVPKADQTDKTFNIVYTGTMSDTYPYDLWLPALEKLKETLKPASLHLHFAGHIGEYIRIAISKSKLANHIDYYGYLDHNRSVSLLTRADALLLVIPQVNNNEGILTGKLFEYLAAGKPVFCIGPPNGDAAQIIESCESGKTFGYEQKNEAIEWLGLLSAQWKDHAPLSAGNNTVNTYSRQSQAKNLAGLIKNMI